MSNQNYESPFSARYASAEMQYIFSPEKKFVTWRKLWIALAQAERELGLNITQEQIDELIANRDNINFEVAEKREKEVRHDVMAHVYAYGKAAPGAASRVRETTLDCSLADLAAPRQLTTLCLPPSLNHAG